MYVCMCLSVSVCLFVCLPVLVCDLFVRVWASAFEVFDWPFAFEVDVCFHTHRLTCCEQIRTHARTHAWPLFPLLAEWKLPSQLVFFG